MAGRLPKAPGLKLIEGDTRKVGSKKFAESISRVVRGPSGRPRMPAGLTTRAKIHFAAIVESLDEMNELSRADEGTILTAALAYAGMLAAARKGKWLDYARCSQRYLQASDRLGLSPSARVRLPNSQPIEKSRDSIESAIA